MGGATDRSDRTAQLVSLGAESVLGCGTPQNPSGVFLLPPTGVLPSPASPGPRAKPLQRQRSRILQELSTEWGQEPVGTTGLAHPADTFFPSRLIEFVLEGTASLENPKPWLIPQVPSHVPKRGEGGRVSTAHQMALTFPAEPACVEGKTHLLYESQKQIKREVVSMCVCFFKHVLQEVGGAGSACSRSPCRREGGVWSHTGVTGGSREAAPLCPLPLHDLSLTLSKSRGGGKGDLGLSTISPTLGDWHKPRWTVCMVLQAGGSSGRGGERLVPAGLVDSGTAKKPKFSLSAEVKHQEPPHKFGGHRGPPMTGTDCYQWAVPAHCRAVFTAWLLSTYLSRHESSKRHGIALNSPWQGLAQG